MPTNLSEALFLLKQSLLGDGTSEWGLAAETLFKRSDPSDLGLVNGALGVESIYYEDDKRIRDWLAHQCRKEMSLRSIFTGEPLGNTNLTLVDLRNDHSFVKSILNENWGNLGAFNGITSIITTERLLAGLRLQSAEEAQLVISSIERCIIDRVGPIEGVSKPNLFSFGNGVLGMVALGCSNYSSEEFIDWCIECISVMHMSMEIRPEGAFVSDGSRMLPYVGNGTAGVLLAMLSIPLTSWPSAWFHKIDKMLEAIAPRFTLNAGFGEGAAGLIYTAARCGNVLNRDIPRNMLDCLVSDIFATRIFKITSPNDRVMFHLMSDGQMAVSRDFWTGTAGLCVALQEYINLDTGGRVISDLVSSLFNFEVGV